MKIFLDTANIAKIKELSQTGLIDGITTNPSLLFKEGGDAKKIILEICSILPDGDISVEITKTNPDDVYKQAKEIAALSKNIIVKIPCHADYYKIINKLVIEEVPVNVTLVFTMLQSLMMAKLGVTYISPFVGRLDDLDVDGNVIISEIREMLDNYNFETELLAASIRTVREFHEAILNGADAVTMPVEIFEKSIKHILTNQGIEKFTEDWKKLGIQQFP
ncbi:MAG: transaldolase family protein [Candidatus Babeliales bacterium]|nr:transaldolase family protein [Candidatus Babeliales bacterium]